MTCHCHHSLVTPIDWKQQQFIQTSTTSNGHHSLVTPIDWKQLQRQLRRRGRGGVTTRW
jgi:hypothetical protein